MHIVRWGIVGCGDVTEVKSGPAFQKADHSSLVAVMRRNGDRARDYATRHSVPRWYDDADQLIHDPDVDAVYVATPPSSHREYVLRAAAAGKPVYVEKPMAINAAECREMVDACRQAAVPLFVAYYRRLLPRFVRIRELVQSGTIGEPQAVSVTLLKRPRPADSQPDRNWRVDPAISGGGYFFDLASHMLDFLDYALGPITRATGIASNQAGLNSAEDTVTGAFRFDSGAHGSGTWCFCADEDRDWTEIHGIRGSIGYVTFDDSPIVLRTLPGGSAKADSALEPIAREISFSNPPHVQQPLIQSVVNELIGSGHCPSTGETALRTARVLDQLVGRPV